MVEFVCQRARAAGSRCRGVPARLALLMLTNAEELTHHSHGLKDSLEHLARNHGDLDFRTGKNPVSTVFFLAEGSDSDQSCICSLNRTAIDFNEL